MTAKENIPPEGEIADTGFTGPGSTAPFVSSMCCESNGVGVNDGTTM